MTNIDSPRSTQPHAVEFDFLNFASYRLVIDARSPREFAHDHIPGAINLPVVGDEQYAEVGTLHRSDPHAAYLVGVEYSLRNIALHIATTIKALNKRDRILVYCFRGGKRSKLWFDALRTIGFHVDFVIGGWKSYRGAVNKSLVFIPATLKFIVVAGSTGTGKTRLLACLAELGEQVIDLEALASHRGSLIGAIPGHAQPSQKYFDTLLIERLKQFDPVRPVWVEDESKKIGSVQLPASLYDAMQESNRYHLEVPIDQRVALWKDEYPNLAEDPVGMVEKLSPLKPLVGGETIARWRQLAAHGQVAELFECVMVEHYDPCYKRSQDRTRRAGKTVTTLPLPSLSRPDVLNCAKALLAELDCARS